MEENKFTRMATQDNFVTEKVDVIKNRLLGTYDDKGEYIIAPQIVDELLNLSKHRKSSYGNSMFCVGNLLGYGEIAFEIAFDKSTDSNTQAKAHLYILEGVDKVNGYLQNTIKTQIAEFSSNVDNFIEESYLKFKVTDESDDDDEEGKEKKDLADLTLDDSYILAKKAYMLLLEKLQDEKMLDSYGKLFSEKLAILTKMDGELAKAILENFNSQYALIEDVFLKDKNYKALNDLIDASIEQCIGTNIAFIDQEKALREQLAPALESFTIEMTALDQETGDKALDMLDNKDRDKLEEMNDSIEHRSEDLLVDTDNIGDDSTEKVITDEVIREEYLEGEHSEILDNPILYDVDEAEEESESADDSQDQDDTQAVQEEHDIEEIIRQNKIQEDFTQVDSESIEEQKVDSSTQPKDLSEQTKVDSTEPEQTQDAKSTSPTTPTPASQQDTIPPKDTVEQPIEEKPESQPKTVEQKPQETDIKKRIEEIININRQAKARQTQKAMEEVSASTKVDIPTIDTTTRDNESVAPVQPESSPEVYEPTPIDEIPSQSDFGQGSGENPSFVMFDTEYTEEPSLSATLFGPEQKTDVVEITSDDEKGVEHHPTTPPGFAVTSEIADNLRLTIPEKPKEGYGNEYPTMNQ